jgi:nicotinamidase-related amidase
MRGGNTDRTFPAYEAHGGESIDPATTAIVMIEYQNEFASEGGKLHDAVKEVMASTSMLDKSVEACEAARAAGAKVRCRARSVPAPPYRQARARKTATRSWPCYPRAQACDVPSDPHARRRR